MSTEEKTRTEVIKALIAVSDALTLLLQEREADAATTVVLDKLASGANPGIPEHAVDTPTVKKARAKKAAQEPQELGPPLSNPAEMNMAAIKPTKPGKTLADLRAALQDCINKNGMPAAKERLAPHAKISDVPDAEIAAVINRLAE